MRSNVYKTLALLLLLSCSKTEEPQIPSVNGTRMTITTDIQTTKTANLGVSTVWASGDEISAIHSEAGETTFYASKFTFVSGNNFEGIVTDLADYNDWYVVYPYNSGNTKATEVNVSVSAAPVQNGLGSTSHIAGDKFPLFGKKLNAPRSDSGISVTMTNALALAKFVVKNTLSVPVTVTGVEFTSAKEIVGDFTVDLTGGTPVWTAGVDAARKIVLSVSGDAEIAAGQSGVFYAGIVPHVIPEGSQLTLAVKAKRSGESEIPCYNVITVSKAVNFTSNLEKSISVSYDEDHSTDPAGSEVTVYNLENDKVKAYLDYTDANPYSPSDYSYTYVPTYYAGTGQDNRLDWPKPVSVSWTGSDAANITVYTNSKMTAKEWTQSVSGNAADIFNLLPGMTYYYKLTNSSDEEIERGVFKTEGRRRMIKVGSIYGQKNANNCRDLGGMTTASGKTIKYKKIYRGSSMDDTDESDKSFLKDYLKVALDVDLRGATSSPLGVTVSGEGYSSFEELTQTDKMAKTIGDIVDAVTAGDVVYIHCLVGADRTGYVCLLLEALLGVPQGLCDIDFEMTSFSGAVGARLRTSGAKTGNIYHTKGVNFINAQTGSTFQEKAVNYVVNTLGISSTKVEAFQNAMLQ